MSRGGHGTSALTPAHELFSCKPIRLSDNPQRPPRPSTSERAHMPDTWQRISAYLRQQPQPVQPADIAKALKLTIAQVHPSLTAAVKRGELAQLPDGSVRLVSSKTTDISSALQVPLEILKKAIEKVPAMKYA